MPEQSSYGQTSCPLAQIHGTLLFGPAAGHRPADRHPWGQSVDHTCLVQPVHEVPIEGTSLVDTPEDRKRSDTGCWCACIRDPREAACCDIGDPGAERDGLQRRNAPVRLPGVADVEELVAGATVPHPAYHRLPRATVFHHRIIRQGGGQACPQGSRQQNPHSPPAAVVRYICSLARTRVVTSRARALGCTAVYGFRRRRPFLLGFILTWLSSVDASQGSSPFAGLRGISLPQARLQVRHRQFRAGREGIRRAKGIHSPERKTSHARNKSS